MGINNPSSGTWVLLHNETLSASDRFDVSDITQVHTHLQLYLRLRTDVASTQDTCFLHINGDTISANYRSWQHFAGTAHDVSVADTPRLCGATAATATAGYFSHIQTFIPMYSQAFNRNILSIENRRNDASGTNLVLQWGLHWESATAITQLTVQPDGYAGDEFVADSILQIWGIE